MHVEFDATQLTWALGVLSAASFVISKVYFTMKKLKQDAKEFIIETVGPKQDVAGEVKRALQNGGGDIIRSIVKTENMAQSEAHRLELKDIVTDAISKHEIVEKQTMNDTIESRFDKFKSEVCGNHPSFNRRKGKR